MAVILLAFGVYFAFALLGAAVFRLLGENSKREGALFASPAVGLSLISIPAFMLNRVGIPASEFTFPLLIAALIVILAVFRRRGIGLPPASVLLLGVFLLTTLIYVGLPALPLGLDWTSYGNDDFANYLLLAQRNLEHGFNYRPSPEELLSGTGYSALFSWSLHLPWIARPGPELLLAMVASVSGLPLPQVFMPLILALHLSLISAAGALVFHGNPRLTAWGAMAICALSPLLVMGTYQQLIAQVGGLTILAVLLRLLFQSGEAEPSASVVKHGLLAAIPGIGLAIWYPEVAPFGALAVLTFTTVSVCRRMLNVKRYLMTLGICIATAVITLNTYLIDLLYFVQHQAAFSKGSTNNVNDIFPQYLIPSGIAALWGLIDLNELPPEPNLSVSIIIGLFLLVALIPVAAVQTWKRQPAGTVTLVMLGTIIPLTVTGQGFGLYKLAMFIQVFMLPTIAVATTSVRPLAPLIIALVAALSLAGQPTFRGYATQSVVGGFSDLNGRAMHDLREVIAMNPSGRIMFDTPDSTTAKVASLFARSQPASFPSRDFFSPFGRGIGDCNLWFESLPRPISQSDAEFGTKICGFVPARAFDLHNADLADGKNRFQANVMGTSSDPTRPCDSLVSSQPTRTVINRSVSNLASATEQFDRETCDSLRHRLIFVQSERGQHLSFIQDFDAFALGKVERDPLLAGTMSAVGRHLLFRVIGPVEPIQIIINMTATFRADGESILPMPSVIGNERRSFAPVGRGAARLVSPPITPQEIHGLHYVAIDMGEDGRQFAETRSGLMGLFGSELRRDVRVITVFARDISIAPRDLAPANGKLSGINGVAALVAGDTEYSGIYEDGWLSEHFFAVLTQPANARSVTVSGEIPLINDPNFSTQVTVLIDGIVRAQHPVGIGRFDVTASLPNGSPQRRVEVRFNDFQRLPSGDGRPVSSYLSRIGFNSSEIAGPNFSFGPGWYDYETFGGESFRWVASEAQLTIDDAKDQPVKLELELAPGPGVGPGGFWLALANDQGEVLERKWVSEREVIQFNLPDVAQTSHRVWLRAEGAGVRPPVPNDPRQLDFRVFTARLLPAE